MSEPRRNSPSIPEPWLSDAWIDRLVDGELSGSDYRAVLEALERHPEHWRRCAQAFLEAQAWRREMADWVSSPTPDMSGGLPFDAIARAMESAAVGAANSESTASGSTASGLSTSESSTSAASRPVALESQDSGSRALTGCDASGQTHASSSSMGLPDARLQSVDTPLAKPQHSALGRSVEWAIDEAEETFDEGDESVENWDQETPRLQAAVFPRSSQDAVSRWQPLPRAWLDWASPLASVAVICGVFWLGWRLSEQASNQVTTWESGGERMAERSNAEAASPLGHVRLAVDGGSQSVQIPYFAPEAYPQGNAVRNSPSVEQVIATRGVDRQRMVMPGRLDERRDVLLPLEVISLPAQTDFQ